MKPLFDGAIAMDSLVVSVNRKVAASVLIAAAVLLILTRLASMGGSVRQRYRDILKGE